MTRRRVNNPLALAVLSCLQERPMHPYQISSTLRQRGKEQSIRLNFGSLYAVVTSLEKHGLITQRERIRSGNRPERTVYEITEAGVTEFEDWLAELLRTPTADPSPLESALSLIAGLPPDEAAELLEERTTRLDLEARRIGADLEWSREQGLPEVFLIEAVFREAMVRAERDFVMRLAADIRSEALGGTSAWRRVHELRAEGVPMDEILGRAGELLGPDARILEPGHGPYEPPHRPQEPGTDPSGA
ncbi:PadR family transcriptional regulator [Intrasporangium sp.]|uniref:PadR family transcriptional regulator n=1 Tax=Intrasporangium sp. TaxID=1925024 RepID=UPI00293966A2|nr:PadR family transcriptional regulator [Intrasporangium sp.]MDV3221685.1 PadR family transcriptional regulator [Intrasporangium sp.]